MPRTFLTARWQDLIILTYAVPRPLLEPFLPLGLELEEWEGRSFASIVAFDFRDCSVLGVRFPGLVNFSEINLRFYVRERWGPKRRGVVFVREFVPRRLIAWVARGVYNEPYRVARMTSSVDRGDLADDGLKRVQHTLKGAADVRLRIEATGVAPAVVPAIDSMAHFFKEHSWGFGTDRRGRTTVYEVRHPAWAVYAEPRARIEGDMGAVYGKEWEILNGIQPAHTMLAVGSEIEVVMHERLKRSA